MAELILRIACLCLSLDGVETLHGIARYAARLHWKVVLADFNPRHGNLLSLGLLLLAFLPLLVMSIR